jgi:YbbR domain-containing protein
MVIEDAAPTEARITLSGYERAFNLMVPSALKVSLDLNSVGEGQQQIVVGESHIKLPQELTLFRVLPRVLSFRVHRWTRSTVDVEARIESRPPENLKLESITVSPPRIQILIWQSHKANTKRVYTEPLDLSRITKTTHLKAKLVLPQHIRLEAGQSPEVQVKVNVVFVSESP